MRILSIETSCDETSAAVTEKIGEQTVKVLSNITATSIALHIPTGGIIPENASREQVKFIIPVITNALLASEGIEKKSPKEDSQSAANVLKEKIDSIAVTHGPGLIGSLLVGVETAKTLSFSLDKPLIPVNHLLAHIFANFIEPSNNIIFPFIGLIVSGGHTDLLLFRNLIDFEWLGGTRDDAAGECFDKCARLLGYSYPGGPTISKLAEKGNPKNVSLPIMMRGDNFDFSFSGLKTAFINAVTKELEIIKKPNEYGFSWLQIELEKLPTRKKQFIFDLCASLEQTIIEEIVRKTLKAVKKYNAKALLLGGGVSANEKLQESLRNEIEKINIPFLSPKKAYTMDNAAMIGAYAALNPAPVDWHNITANPDLYFS